MVQKKKGGNKVLTNRTSGWLTSAKLELLNASYFLRSVGRGVGGVLLYATLIGLGLMFLYNVVELGEVGHRVLGIFLVLYGGLAGFFRLGMEMSTPRALVQAARLMGASGAFLGIVYLLQGFAILAAYVLPISLLVLVGGHYLWQYLSRPEVIEEPDGTRGAYR